MTEKNPPSDGLSVHAPVVDGKLVVPLYFVDGFRRRAMRKSVDDSGIDWARFAKGVRVQLWSGKDGISVTSEDTSCIP